MTRAVGDNVIEVSAVVLRNAAGSVLTVRKRGTRYFMLPGGKLEPGESAEAAAVREVFEELLVSLELDRLRFIGLFSAQAANEPGFTVRAMVYEHPSVAITEPAAEIDEIRWDAPDLTPYPADLAPLLAEQIFPALAVGEGVE